MIDGTGWHALYTARNPDGTHDFTWTSRHPVVAWVDTTVPGSPDITVHGYVAEFGSPSLKRVDEVEITGSDGREQLFALYVRVEPDTNGDGDPGA